MKNNILLILAVTVISIGIIIATVLVSGAGNDSGRESSSSSDTGRQTTTSSSAEELYMQPTEDAPLAQTPVTAEPPETSAPSESIESSYDSVLADSVIATAHSLIGIDFAEGGDTPEAGFDNSGFIYYVLRENGYITCPREVKAQSEMGAALTFDQLRKGDLVFFYGDDKATVAFGGIYCGDGMMIACLMPGTQVKEINITSSYYTEYFCKGIGIT